MKNKKIYTYEKEKNYTKKTTDKLISSSVKDYLKRHGYSGDAVKVIRDDRGKPIVQSKPKVFASATHTDNIVVVVVAGHEIGIDCEEISREVKNIDRLAHGFFSESEQMTLHNLSEEDKRLSFLKIWVKKESYVKLTGIGLSEIKRIDTFSLPKNIVFTDTDIGEEYFVSVCENIKTPR